MQSSADNTDHEGDTFESTPDSPEPAERPKSGNSRHSANQPAESVDTPKGRPGSYIEIGKENGHRDSTIRAELVEKSSDAQPSTKSPLLTTHRKSIDSLEQTDLSNLQDENAPADSAKLAHVGSDPSKPPLSIKTPSLSARLTGFSASLPSVPWGAPPKRTLVSRDPSPQPQQQVRKITSPFAWLGRSTSTPKESQSPPLRAAPTDRRNTAASISTLGSNPELMLRALEDGQDSHSGAKSGTKSLRDRFKLLRLREEAGIASLEDPGKADGGTTTGLVGRSVSLGVGIGSPQSMSDEKEGGVSASPVSSQLQYPTAPSPTIVDSKLLPGTVSGVSTSAQDAAGPIDWDFWQAVVNEGPQAVARTSPEELSHAISCGIPQTIRGVIWQVLANSKNEDLEAIYQALLLRGTDKECVARPATTNGMTNGHVKEKESITSSASSVHSDHSTPATSFNAGVASPGPSNEMDAAGTAKLQAKMSAERQAKAKEDSAAIAKLEKMIKRDMGSRTSYSKYAVAAGFQDGLFNICKAYALFDEAVGYPQGMNFIVMPILFTMPEEEAFCLLVRLMNKYGLRELFTQDMPGLHLHLYQFERLLEDLEPALYCHLNRKGVSPKLYATQWFLTLFAYRFPLQLVMRVYDLVLSEGLEGAILKFGMAVVQRNVATLLGMNDMLALTNFLKEKLFDVFIDQTPSSKSILESGFFGSSGGSDSEIYRADLLVQDACVIKVTPEMLNKYRTEWEEKVKIEKEREAEIENYRTTVASQVAKIRSLEERVEKSDAEHVQIATNLVRLKVENQELQDGNESLRGQVQELRKVVESEAANVEKRLKAEMDRVMQRNIEVQNENRHMEESLAEMEKNLVETKMKYAEANENLHALQRKLNDFRKALD